MLTRVCSLMAGRQERGLHPGDSMMVNVCYRSLHTPYDLPRGSTVGQLRQRVAADNGVAASEVKILLGGSVLEDEITMESSGIGMASTLFAIQQRSPPLPPLTVAVTVPSPCPPVSAAGVEASGAAGGDPSPGQSAGRGWADQYFVYCKLCMAVRPGRLRVKCSVCGDGAVLVDKGPGGWADVLTPGRLTGSCQSHKCQLCVPVFYFKCAVQHGGNVSGTAVALQHMKPNRCRVRCITCEDVESPVIVFPCQSSHVMCQGCFVNYCTVRLRERRFVHSRLLGYSLPCPAGCADSLLREQHHFCLLGQHDYGRYKDFAAEECLLAEGGLFCPRPDCGAAFLLDAEDTRVLCPHCQHLFCRRCRERVHEGECSPLSSPRSDALQGFSDPGRVERAQWERQSARTIQQTTKGCPGCGTRTERDGGCMHMVCARCGEDWCWLCVKTWDRDCQAAHWFD